MRKKLITIFVVLLLPLSIFGQQKLLIPMDQSQTDHLKAYGVAYWTLKQGINVEWLLNYKGGSFLIDYHDGIARECRVRNVTHQTVSPGQVTQIYSTIEQNNMDMVLLEKAPKIAIYTPPNKRPWDDAVTMALTYAEIDYETLWDRGVLDGELSEYDWLHLHHEDFTGQYGKFYKNYHTAPWYIEQQMKYEAMAEELGFKSVQAQKKAVAWRIREYVVNGGFMFAMCSATDALDIALSAQNVDIAGTVYDGTPMDPNAQQKLNFSLTFAFENFQLETDPLVYEYSNIDIPPSYSAPIRGAEGDYFSLFEFSAKYDPVPTMLTQNHVAVVKDFMGQTTSFNRKFIKDDVVIMGEFEGTQRVKYLHGNAGQGTFTYYGGHDPEDFQHFVGDPPTQLSLHKNSPGYRLILNNVLFPAAKKQKRKT
ncbi:MAG: asparagine synthetase B [Candidatus Marinimicrobia bacterium]|nr:asparagine synthetase B [Candidatus Neomarinimicrobiota bacterium]MCF7830137.1 asparagine synthetase B [Candidatus Neomarinimicrobiota bacterium]MCF7882214.1 asparagine synthetase B [Candidatus Neomarinimicrobiota bacterium]